MKQQKTRLAKLSQDAQQELLSDVYQRAEIEACGVLLGSQVDGCWTIEHAHPLRNTAHSAVYFEFAPEELLEAELAYPGQIVGVYHSHPTGYARASSTDKENMKRVNLEQAIPWLWLILCGPFNAPTIPSQPQEFADRLIAYHHFAKEGLRRIEVYYKNDS